MSSAKCRPLCLGLNVLNNELARKAPVVLFLSSQLKIQPYVKISPCNADENFHSRFQVYVFECNICV